MSIAADSAAGRVAGSAAAPTPRGVVAAEVVADVENRSLVVVAQAAVQIDDDVAFYRRWLAEAISDRSLLAAAVFQKRRRVLGGRSRRTIPVARLERPDRWRPGDLVEDARRGTRPRPRDGSSRRPPRRVGRRLGRRPTRRWPHAGRGILPGTRLRCPVVRPHHGAAGAGQNLSPAALGPPRGRRTALSRRSGRSQRGPAGGRIDRRSAQPNRQRLGFADRSVGRRPIDRDSDAPRPAGALSRRRRRVCRFTKPAGPVGWSVGHRGRPGSNRRRRQRRGGLGAAI